MTVSKLPILSGILGVLFSSTVLAVPNSVVQLCTSDLCVAANRVVTPEALYQRLGELVTKNTGRKLTFCDADPSIRLCFQQMLPLSASSHVMTADVSVDSADVLEVKKSSDETVLTALLDMSVEVNGTYPACETAQAKFVVGEANKVSVVINNFGCSVTSALTSDLNMGLVVDYIDFEKAVLGGYYTFSSSKAMHGMRSGYALLRFAEPVSGHFEGIIPLSQADVSLLVEQTQEQDTANPEEKQECAPCVAKQIRDDEAVRTAIEAATRAETEAKAAADRAVKMAEEAAQATKAYALKKAGEAEKAKQEAEKAAQLAQVARSRIEEKTLLQPYAGHEVVQIIPSTATVVYDEDDNKIAPTVVETVVPEHKQ